MKNKYKFSIVIPIYNSLEKISNCIESLISQTHDNFEVIFVDDCSSDESYSYLTELKNSKRLDIKLIKNKENQGPGYSRTVGIENASGDFVLFIDSDDYIKKDTLEKFNLLINNYSNIDCICFDYILKKGSYESIKNTVNSEESCFLKPEDAMLLCDGTVCGKVFSLEIIRKHNIKFPLLKRNEDMPFIKVSLSYCKNIYYYKEPFYYYVMYETSLMHDKNLLDENNSVKAFEYIKKYVNKDIKFNIELLFIREVLYSNIVAMISKGSDNKTFYTRMDKIETMYPLWYKNAGIKTLPNHCKIVLFLFHHKMIFLLRCIIFMKNKIKK